MLGHSYVPSIDSRRKEIERRINQLEDRINAVYSHSYN
jgi:hypothetical protein